MPIPSTNNFTSSERILVDDLPYVDQEYGDPVLREAALALVDEETRRYRPTKNYLEHLPPLELSSFETPLMKTEFERLSQKKPMDVLSMKRYELPPPSAGRLNDLQAWIECVDNSMAQLEHQTTRILNLELMSEYGCESWRIYNTVLSQMISQSQKQLQELKKQIQDVNWARKKDQTEVGDKIKHLEATWFGLITKNYEIELACAEIERQLASLNE
ncbi:Pre-mR-splicing factor SPF27 [Daphnia sinensis]|uniref:Pre-mRNA-splicing factor SPF27 n=1 Tax=Daphnia sinensis TaxID=1820382 RepID=A0AAD5L591_9CRUS|nr:Pre-mR-splicing factor SPF27 [Daphnia sinensis]